MATLAGLGFGSGTAQADPSSTPSLNTLVGVGSFSMAPLFDNGVPGGDSGTFVHDYNARTPAYPVASWDVVNPSKGVAYQTITTKAASSSDTGCQLVRPVSDDAGGGPIILGRRGRRSNLAELAVDVGSGPRVGGV